MNGVRPRIRNEDHDFGSWADRRRHAAGIVPVSGGTHRDHPMGLDFVLSHVASFYGVSVQQLRGVSKTDPVVCEARTMYFGLARDMTPESHNNIAAMIHRHDHTTSLFQIRKFRRLVREGPLRERAEKLRTFVQDSWVRWTEEQAA